jgi:hypothetical protein
MRKITALAAAALTAAALIPATSSGAQTPAATIMLLHGIPGVDVDVAVGGNVVIDDFNPGEMQDLSSFAGQTLRNLEVRAAGTTTVAIGPVAAFDVPATGNWTVVAHLNATGAPTLTPFQNDTSAVPAGQGRLTVRHLAQAPAVDILVGDARPFTNLANPREASAALPAGRIANAKVAPTGGDPIADVPAVNLQAGTNLIVYAVGSLTATPATFTFYTQTVTGLGGAPTRVDTGDSLVPEEDGALGVLPFAIAGIALAAAAGIVVNRRASQS